MPKDKKIKADLDFEETLKQKMKASKADIDQRLGRIKLWPEKEARLRQEKKMKRSDLCRKYGIDQAVFCSALKLRFMPRWRMINRIDEAFKAEGIE